MFFRRLPKVTLLLAHRSCLDEAFHSCWASTMFHSPKFFVATVLTALAAIAWAHTAIAQPHQYQYRLPIEGLRASVSDAAPVDERPEVRLEALTSTDFGSAFTHDLMVTPLIREFILTNLDETGVQLHDIRVNGPEGLALAGGTCGVGPLDSGQACSILVRFDSRESVTLTDSQLSVSGEFRDGAVALGLSGKAITAFRDSLAGQAPVLTEDRLTATWATGSEAGRMRVGVGRNTGRRYVEFVAAQNNVSLGVGGSPGDVLLNLSQGKASTTMNPAPVIAAGDVPVISANDRIGLSVDFYAGELRLSVNCVHRVRLTGIPTTQPLAITVHKPKTGAQTVALNAGSAPFGCEVPAGYKAGW